MKGRLTRAEAAAVIKDALRDQPLPFPYVGGWGQILSDFACLSKRTIANMAVEGRETIGGKRDTDTAKSIRHSQRNVPGFSRVR